MGLPSAGTRRLVHVMGLSKGWKFRTADITTAYLQALFRDWSGKETDIYVRIPDCKYYRQHKIVKGYRPGSVHKVLKALYG